MRKLLLSSFAGAMALATLPASAMTGAQLLAPAAAADQPSVTLVSGGCGPFRHRGWNGFCYPGGGWGYGYGWHRPWGYGYGWHRPWGWHRGWGWHRW